MCIMDMWFLNRDAEILIKSAAKEELELHLIIKYLIKCYS